LITTQINAKLAFEKKGRPDDKHKKNLDIKKKINKLHSTTCEIMQEWKIEQSLF